LYGKRPHRGQPKGGKNPKKKEDSKRKKRLRIFVANEKARKKKRGLEEEVRNFA